MADMDEFYRRNFRMSEGNRFASKSSPRGVDSRDSGHRPGVAVSSRRPGASSSSVNAGRANIRVSTPSSDDSHLTDTTATVTHAGLDVGIGSVTEQEFGYYERVAMQGLEWAYEHILSHPWITLRRQCQVNPSLGILHVTPFTLIGPVLAMRSSQGGSCFWKGLGSAIIFKGMLSSSEVLLAKLTLWPKVWPDVQEELPPSRRKYNYMLQVGQHLCLKMCSFALTVPFYTTSLIDSVQSDVIDARSSVFDVFAASLGGFKPLLNMLTNSHHPPLHVSSRTLSIITTLIPVSIGYFVSRYILTTLARRRQQSIQPTTGDHEAKHDALYKSLYTVAANFVVEFILYPVETVMNRVHLQGTRTIIDHLGPHAIGNPSVTPVITRYAGIFDCYQSIIVNEGPLALFKGFGSLVLQYAAGTGLLISLQLGLAELKRLADSDGREHSKRR